MKTLTIFPSKDGFDVEFKETQPQKNVDLKPHPLGFYAYDSNLKESTAFNRLKRVMIKDKENLIELLKKEIKQLKGMKYDNS